MEKRGIIDEHTPAPESTPGEGCGRPSCCRARRHKQAANQPSVSPQERVERQVFGDNN